MKAIVFAYNDPGCVGLEALLKHDIEVVAVFTHRDNPDENIYFHSVAELAAARGIPVYAPEDVNHPLWVQRISELKPDVIYSFYYRKILCEEILDIPAKGAYNLHGSLLPSYRGRCPVNWAILNGESQTGVTLHKMTATADSGDIIAQQAFPITDSDDAKSVFSNLTAAAEQLLDKTIPAIRDGKATATPQDESKATYFGGRKPADGEIAWNSPVTEIINLIRAVTKPYPGAFTFSGDRKVLLWQAKPAAGQSDAAPGQVLSTSPLQIACAPGQAIEVTSGEVEGSITIAGSQLAAELGLVDGLKLGPHAGKVAASALKKRVLILGVNGFIGNALVENLLERGGYDVFGMDINSDKLSDVIGKPGFEFREGDISIHREWIEYHVRKCDVVLPLVAIATPIEYVRNPLRVFELDFEENLRVVRNCVKYNKRVIFPSTSEIYGMCSDEFFDEDNSKLVLGPIRMQRWIYSCSKQLLDRVIWAYGQQRNLNFTLFRPFNWVGPKLDSLDSARIGSSRAITQLILNLVEGSPIQLVDGGEQKRCFTDISDGIECLARLIDNVDDRCNGQIVNIGNPDNEASIRQLAEILVDAFEKHPLRHHFPPFAGYREVESGTYYGKGYQDVLHRRPSIKNANKLVDWHPSIKLNISVRNTLDYFLQDLIQSQQESPASAPEIIVTASMDALNKPGKVTSK